MKKLTFAMVAVLSTSFAANAAIVAGEVQMAMEKRAIQSETIIDDLRVKLSNATGSDRGQIMREIRTEIARARQLASFARIVPRLPQRRLQLIIAKYNLPVSPH